MSETRAESPQQQDAENDIAGVSTWQLLLRKKCKINTGIFRRNVFNARVHFVGLYDAYSFTWN